MELALLPWASTSLNLQGGVTSVTVEFNFSNPLAAAFAEPVPRTNSPFLVGFRTQNTVTAANLRQSILASAIRPLSTAPSSEGYL